MAAVLVCAGVAGTVDASPARNDDLARSYAFAFSGAFEAQRHCPGLETDDTAIIALRQAAGLGGDKDDRDFLRARFDELRPALEREIATKGTRAWCAEAWDTFGPKGLRSLRRR